MKLQNPAHRITVVERNKPFDTFGWGVVLSDQTLGNLHAADPVTGQQIGDALNHWDDIEVFFKGRSVRSGGHGFCGIGRKHLLNILQERCIAGQASRIGGHQADSVVEWLKAIAARCPLPSPAARLVCPP